MSHIFESGDVIELVGISSIYLNKFVELGLYGVTPSERREVGRGKRRWFNSEDVFGIALVWWLFEAGLRSEVIKRVLRELVGQNQANANRVAAALRENGPDFLVIRRPPRTKGLEKTKRAPQIVEMLSKREVLKLIENGESEAVHAIPVGKLFRKLELMIQESS